MKGDRSLRGSVARRALEVAGDPRRERVQGQQPGVHGDALRRAQALHRAAQAERVGPGDLHRADLVDAPPPGWQPVGPQPLLAAAQTGQPGPDGRVPQPSVRSGAGGSVRLDRLVTWTTAMAGRPFSTRGGSTAGSSASRGRRAT